MNTPQLFRIIVLHGAPKDSHTSTETYLVAKDETEVFEWIDRVKNYGAWTENHDGEPKTRWCDDAGEDVPFRDWIMARRGDLKDDEGWDDAYYGVTKWGWELVTDTMPGEIAVLLRLGVAVEVTTTEKP